VEHRRVVLSGTTNDRSGHDDHKPAGQRTDDEVVR
jgi:hypothetical protein